MKKLPSIKEFIEALEQSLEYCKSADDVGSVSFEMARWQEWVLSWPDILTEEGGI